MRSEDELTSSGLGEGSVPDSTSQNCEILKLSVMRWIAA